MSSAGHAADNRAAKPVRMNRAVRDIVYRRDKYRCRSCSRTWGLSLHHIKAKRDGGQETVQNMVVLCRECHDLAEEGLVVV